MTQSDSPAHALRALLDDRTQKPVAIAALLDGLDHEPRVTALRSLGRHQLQALFERVDGFGELGLDDLVPAGT
ncbi:MAG TPA: hypothetical protein VHZ95_22465, partial [Polyangiales bacterium]|nr:hypothetical protein [Polyangiales bacterium]